MKTKLNGTEYLHRLAFAYRSVNNLAVNVILSTLTMSSLILIKSRKIYDISLETNRFPFSFFLFNYFFYLILLVRRPIFFPFSFFPFTSRKGQEK